MESENKKPERAKSFKNIVNFKLGCEIKKDLDCLVTSWFFPFSHISLGVDRQLLHEQGITCASTAKLTDDFITARECKLAQSGSSLEQQCVQVSALKTSNFPWKLQKTTSHLNSPCLRKQIIQLSVHVRSFDRCVGRMSRELSDTLT